MKHPGAMACLAALIGLAACDSGGSAVESRDRGAARPVAASEPVLAAENVETPVETSAPATPPRTVLTGNRRENADGKADRLFQRNGADFGAETVDDYLAMVRRFIADPPAGTERAVRANGDTLLYHPRTNTFAVVARNGVARTMFKPREGAAYWERQKAQAPEFGRRRSEQD